MKKWVKIKDNIIDFTVPDLILPRSPIYAAIDAVNKIVKEYPSPYHVLASGGIDSQAMLYAWKLSNQPHNVISFQYNDGMNAHDLDTLKEFSAKENINVTYIHFDFFSFIKNEYDAMANRYQCSSPLISAYIRFTEILGGTCVFSGNFLGISGAFLTHAILALHRHSLTDSGKNTIPYFFLHTPELAYSLRNYDISTAHTHEGKIDLYKQAHFPIIPQSQKFSGFEKYKDYYDQYYGDIYKNRETRMKYARKPSQRAFDWILRYPYEEKFNDPHYKFMLNPL